MKNMNKKITSLMVFSTLLVASGNAFAEGKGGKLRIGINAGTQFDMFGFTKDFQKLSNGDAVAASSATNNSWYRQADGSNYTSANVGNAVGASSSSSDNTLGLATGLDISYDVSQYFFVRSGFGFTTLISGGSSEYKNTERGHLYNLLLNPAGAAVANGAAAGQSATAIATVTQTFKGSFMQVPLLLGLGVPILDGLEIYGAMGPSFYSGSFTLGRTIDASNTLMQSGAYSQTSGAEDKSMEIKMEASGIGLMYVAGVRTSVGNNVDIGIEMVIDAFAKDASADLGTTSENDKAYDRTIATGLAAATKGTYIAGNASEQAKAYFPVSFSGLSVKMSAGYRLDL